MKKRVLSLILTAVMLSSAFVLASCGNAVVRSNNVETVNLSSQNNEGNNGYMNMIGIDLSQYVSLDEFFAGQYNISFLVDDADINSAIESMAYSASQQSNVGYKVNSGLDRVTQKGDMLNIDFSGSIDGVPFEGGTAQGYSVLLSEQSGMIPGFIDDLYGVALGTTVETNVTFPANYHVTDLAGKPAKFEIKVNYIEKYGFTDTTIAAYSNGLYTTLDALRTAYRQSIIKDRLDNKDTHIISELYAIACEKVKPVLLPEQQINYYIALINKNYKDYFDKNVGGTDAEYTNFLAQYGITDETIRKEAEENTTTDVIFSAIINEKKVTLTDAEKKTRLEAFAKNNGYTDGAAFAAEVGEVCANNIVLMNYSVQKLPELVKYETDYEAVKAQYGTVDNSAITTAPTDTTAPAAEKDGKKLNAQTTVIIVILAFGAVVCIALLIKFLTSKKSKKTVDYGTGVYGDGEQGENENKETDADVNDENADNVENTGENKNDGEDNDNK